MTDVQTRTDAGHSHDEDEPTGTAGLSRRRAVIAGAGALGATCFLAACGTSAPSTSTPNGSDFEANPAPAGSAGADAGGTGNDNGGDTGGGDTGGGAAVLVAAADVPEGGGIIKGNYVITQPASGTYKAFTKVCTHQGCDVNKIDGGLILCPCHGAKFSIEDGSVKGGPAPKGLDETAVKVDGDNIVKA